jgi:ribosomal protein S12 methylthiotransferase accessory factor
MNDTTSSSITETLARLERLVSPYGVVSVTEATETRFGNRTVQRCLSKVGSSRPGSGTHRDDHIICGGATVGSADKARLVAIAEGAERYAGRALLHEERIWATADELAGQCLEPQRYPRCSTAEIDHEDCPVVPFDTKASIRWVRGMDLVRRTSIWVPATMANYGTERATRAEYFTFPISTGYAVHTDPVEAVVRGILEVAERDSIALLWLQKLPLPRLSPAVHTDAVDDLIAWFGRRFMRVYLLDATSDLGIPTVFCVVAADHDPRACRFVSAATGRTIAEAAESALVETADGDELIYSGAPSADILDDVGGEIGETSKFMAVRERAHAFDFLLDEGNGVSRGEHTPLPESPDDTLAVLTDRLSRLGMQGAVVDRTTQELTEAGLTAMSVVIPDLQPMSTHPRAQFRGHDRLYSAPGRMGYRTLPEEELNPWPQPFA